MKQKIKEFYWKTKLSPEQFRVLRKKGTEKAFSNKYWSNKQKGEYHCAGCKSLLFSSSHKYDSDTGWPSFYDSKGELKTDNDHNFFVARTEILCKKCEGHLGHVFNDGPSPTGKRFCVNSTALNFKEK